MATTRRGLRETRGSRRDQSPHTLDDRHEIDEDEKTKNSDKQSPSKDLIDGTTQHTPHSTHTPPGTPSTLHTSGHTHCTSTTTTTRRRIPATTKDEEEKIGTEKEARTKGKTAPTTTSKPHHHHSHHHAHHHHQGPAPALLIFICFLVLVGVYSLYQSLRKMEEEQKAAEKEPKSITEIYDDLKLELQTVNREFAQPREVWLGLLGQLEAVMVEEPSQPAVLLMVVPDDAYGAASCLAHRLATAVQNAFEESRFVMFDTLTSQYLDDSAALKLDLDRTLEHLAGAHAAVIHNVESLPGQAAMILHAYCDNENAPYKQAIMFLLAAVPGTYEELAYSRLDSLVDSYLEKVWGGDEGEGEARGTDNKGGLKKKDVFALISRTANSPLLIRPERMEKIMQLCPV